MINVGSKDIDAISWLRSFNLLMFDDIDSTNTEAKRLAECSVDGDFVIWAKSQNNGRGRAGKEWISEEGNLYMSLLLRPRCAFVHYSEISFVTAISVGEVIFDLVAGCEGFKEMTSGYKWPNDILVDGKKISGILLETLPYSVSNSEERWLIIGIGINITSL